jgi:hypothetical protein
MVRPLLVLINNPNLAPIQWDVSNKDAEIHRIEFLNDSIGYITGGASSNYFPSHPNASPGYCAIFRNNNDRRR